MNEGYERLKKFRTASDLKLKPLKHLKAQYEHFGQVRDLKLRYYQIIGVLHLAACPRFILGDDTGIGKTIQAITAMCSFWESNPDQKVVVLTTKSAVSQWASEVLKFTQEVTPFMCKGTPTQRARAREEFQAHQGPAVMVMGYRSMVQDFTSMQEWKGYILVADEASAFKSDKSRVHKCTKHLATQASRVWGLTATLIRNNLIEGHGIYSVVVPGLFESKNKFIAYYAYTRLQSVGKMKVPVIIGYPKQKVVEFREKIDPFYLGRAKHEVATELPVLEQKMIEVTMTPEQASLYQEALDMVHMADAETHAAQLQALIRCQQIVDHPALIEAEGESSKVDQILDFIQEEGSEFAGEKIIIFSKFVKFINHLEGVLQKAKIPCVRITGEETKEEQRALAQSKFQDPSSGVDVILITTAASEAINLQAAKAIIFVDTPWSAGEYLQIIGRMIRIGSQHDRCYVIHLVSKWRSGKTIDHRVIEVLSKKMKLVEAVIGKRIKGEGDMADDVLTRETLIEDLFSAMRSDAKKQ